MQVALHQGSWLRFSPLSLLEIDGVEVEVWGAPDLPPIQPQNGDIRHEVTSTDRLDKLSYKYYQTDRLDWLIAVANGIQDFTLGLVPGAEITIPAPAYVLSRYLKARR